MQRSVETVGYNKHYPKQHASLLIMSQKKERSKKHQHRPAMDEASNPIHDANIKKIREQEKT
jgi:hypothetical protein